MKEIKSGRKRPALKIALVGLMAATIESAKLVLAFLPNIEAVTLLTALYGYVFGILGVFAAIVFVSIEPLIYGFNTWVVSYYLYWPFVAAVFMLLAKLRIKNRFILTGAAVLLTAWFGALTSLIDIGLLSGFFDNFWQRFAIYYMRGVPFYAAQVITNLVLFLLVFPYLRGRLDRVRSSLL